MPGCVSGKAAVHWLGEGVPAGSIDVNAIEVVLSRNGEKMYSGVSRDELDDLLRADDADVQVGNERERPAPFRRAGGTIRLKIARRRIGDQLARIRDKASSCLRDPVELRHARLGQRQAHRGEILPEMPE